MEKFSRTLLYALAPTTLLLITCSSPTASAPPSGLNSNNAAEIQLVGGGNADEADATAENSIDSNANEENGNDPDADGNEVEVSGMVEAMTAETLTISGVTYMIADFTEFMNVIMVGDQVNIHTITNADSTFTISEIEISDSAGNDNDDENGDDSGDNEKG